MKTRGRWVNWMLALALLLVAAPLAAQNRYGGYYDDDPWLDDLVAPVALYPDDVLAILLPASMYPDDLQDAGGFLRDPGDDRYAQPDPDWDQSVRYLLNYPEVVYRFNDDPQWTADLGSAFASDDRAVMEAIQRMRWRAYDEGFLRSDSRQRVIIDDGRIRIVSVSPEYIYIPDYDSSIFYSRPVGWSYGYYDTAYPLYYYPYGSDYRFDGRFYGGQSAWCIDWWGWDIASGIILDWAFWHHSHHNDFYGWQRDWSRHRHDPREHWSPYMRSAGTSIATQPSSPQVQPLQHPIARPASLPPPTMRPAPLVRPIRPERPLRPEPGVRPELRQAPIVRPERSRIVPVPERVIRPAEPIQQPIPRFVRPERREPVVQPVPQRVVRTQPVVGPIQQPVLRPIPQPVATPAQGAVVKPVNQERDKKARDRKDDDQKDGRQ